VKIISKKYWQDVKNFVEQILIKFRGFYLIKLVLFHTKISVVGRYSKDQISADNIGGPIYRSVFILNIQAFK